VAASHQQIEKTLPTTVLGALALAQVGLEILVELLECFQCCFSVRHSFEDNERGAALLNGTMRPLRRSRMKVLFRLPQKGRNCGEPPRRPQHSEKRFSRVERWVGMVEVIALKFRDLDTNEISGKPFIDRIAGETLP
jgi:hypothetical protein